MEYMGSGRTPGEKTAHGLHVQDRSEIAASPPAENPISELVYEELPDEEVFVAEASYWVLFDGWKKEDRADKRKDLSILKKLVLVLFSCLQKGK